MSCIFFTMLRFEALSVMRVRETYTFVLLPALLFFPVVLSVIVLLASFDSRDTIAVPEQDPPGLALGDILAVDYRLLRTPDPGAAFDRGDADLAIVGWSLEDIDVPPDTWFAMDLPAPSWLTIEARGAPEQRNRVEWHLNGALRHEIDRVIERRGGGSTRDRRLASVDSAVSATVTPAPRFDTGRMTLMSFVGLALYGGCFLIPVRTAAERLSGVLESMAVTRTPLLVLFVARVLVCTVLVPVALALPASVLLLLVGDTMNIDVGVLDTAEGVAALVLGNALFVLCGVHAKSTRLALYAASYLVLVLFACFGAGAYAELPFLPLFGLGLERPVAQVARIGATLALAGAVLVGTGVLVRWERVLPPAPGGE